MRRFQGQGLSHPEALEMERILDSALVPKDSVPEAVLRDLLQRHLVREFAGVVALTVTGIQILLDYRGVHGRLRDAENAAR